jgi:hypothetical protein
LKAHHFFYTSPYRFSLFLLPLNALNPTFNLPHVLLDYFQEGWPINFIVGGSNILLQIKVGKRSCFYLILLAKNLLLPEIEWFWAPARSNQTIVHFFWRIMKILRD